MTTRRCSPVLRCVRKMAQARMHRDGTDWQLLERFTTRRDEAAFAALVRRHGPMVWGVCRRVLPRVEDAEDAFQATFLVLVRKAASLRQPELLGSWLHGVAFRTASRAKVEAAKRRAHEQRAAERPAAEPTDSVLWRDLRPVLDDEIRRLPDRYRSAFVLCYLQGRTNREAAQELGCPEGTILSRLAAARQRLRARLVRRGLSLTVAALGCELSLSAAPAAVPGHLFGPTLRTAAAFADGRAIPLAEAVLRTMTMTRAMTTLFGVLALGLAGMGSAVLIGAVSMAGPTKLRATTPTRAAQPPVAEVAPKGRDQSGRDRRRLQGQWLPLPLQRPAGRFLDLTAGTLTFKEDRVTIDVGKEQLACTYRLDAAGQPRAITLTVAGKTFPGIYSLDGDYLEVCFTDRPGAARPRAFVTTADLGGNYLFVLRRASAKGDPVRDRSRFNLKSIGLAMHDYRKAHGRFPPAAIHGKDGKALLSWRVEILPHLEQKNLYTLVKQNAPWNDPANAFLSSAIVKTYASPAGINADNLTKTYYQVFTGKGTAFEDRQGARLQDITDSLSGTILVAEAADPIPWPEPADLPYAPDKPLPKLGGLFIDGFHVLLADGSVRFIKAGYDAKLLRRAITRNDGHKIDWDDLSP